jgi:hypothetical protein
MSVLSCAPTTAAPPVLRLLPAPVAEPPYDDERPAALRRLRTRPLRLTGAPLHLVPEPTLDAPAEADLVAYGPTTDGLPPDEDRWSRPRTALRALSPAQPFARALLQRLLEALAGVRPVSQLQAHTTPDLYARLEDLVAARPRHTGARPDARAVRSVHVQVRPEGVAEVCATVQRPSTAGPRVHAVALRLEGLEGRWCCTELAGL